MAKNKPDDTTEPYRTDAQAAAAKTDTEKYEAHRDRLSRLKDPKTAQKEDGTTSNASPLHDLTTSEGLDAYGHKMANVTRGDLILAMQNGGKDGLELLTAKWDLLDHGNRFATDAEVPLEQRASQGHAQQVQGARHADVVAEQHGEAPRPYQPSQPQHSAGKGTADKPYP